MNVQAVWTHQQADHIHVYASTHPQRRYIPPLPRRSSPSFTRGMAFPCLTVHGSDGTVDVRQTAAEPARGNVYPTSRALIDNVPSRAPSESRAPHDVDEREPRKRASPTKDQDETRSSSDIHRPPLAHAKDSSPSTSLQHLFDAQSRELSVLQHERRALLEDKKTLTDAYATLKQHYDERSKKLSTVRHERQAALEQRNEIDDAYMTLKQQYEEQTKKLDAVHRAALEQKHRAEEDYTALRQKYDAQKNDYNTLGNKYQSLKAMLEQRTSELQGVQKFLTTADAFSGSEVVNTLRRLNEEVQQSTTFMAEWAVENFVLEAQQTNIEETRTSETLGMKYMQLLGTKKHKDNPILVEMAFRAYLTYELYWVASPWGVGQEEQAHNVYIDTIYQRIREAEGQAISGNWRALTRAYTLPACISDPEHAETIGTTIASGFADILSAAGCTGSKSDITSAFWTKFGDNIHHFVSLAGQVNKIIGVGVISEDFEVLVIWPNVSFDERTMEDSYDNGDRVQGSEERKETVLCATELGLMQRMKVRGQEEASELIVIKPKVALASVIDMIDE